ncbi:MAG: glycosyltransferase family 2 protein [Leptospiraceae bacterium]|nr:glycosyltransferase family 2 protein [Leptospiraceae bacterium]
MRFLKNLIPLKIKLLLVKILPFLKKNQVQDLFNTKLWLNLYEGKIEKYKLNKESRNPKVCIVSLSYKNLDYTKLCLKSIFASTTYDNFEVIVVDNASEDGTAEWLLEYQKTHPNLKLILNKENLGFSGGNNQAVRETDSDYVIFLNNDTVVTEGWIEGMLEVFLTDPKIGLVGPVTNAIGNEACILVDYTHPKNFESYVKNRKNKLNRVFEIRMVAFFCAMTKRDVYLSLGGLDERYSVGMFEDDDMCVTYQKAGYKIYCTEKVFIHHFHGASFKKLNPDYYSDIFEENRKKYESKWKKTWTAYEMRPEVQAFIQKQNP